MRFFAWGRFVAMVVKEFTQMRRDRMTFAMMIGLPLVQLVIFGFAINMDPKHLPAAAIVADASPFGRSILGAMENSGYFAVTHLATSEAEADDWLQRGKVQFVVSIPADFSRALLRGERPAILVEADATDPSATSNAIAALEGLNRTALQHDLVGGLAGLKSGPPPFEVRIHRRYNPEGSTQYNVVPGLIGVILTMTMVIMTALAVTRERERGTMEALLATPVSPLEVLIGKIVPYILVGFIQVTIVFVVARLLFDVPMLGSSIVFGAVVLLFIAANLAVGITFSTVARNQLQAMQMAIFFFLPSIMLSGFVFPFRGMPTWAQAIGEVLPLTHFLRIVRGVMLKGTEWTHVMPDVWPLAAFLLVAVTIALARYRRTLD
ncbi:MAG: ABC transporter permease [Alphaproteobacteria bacterium]|nr:ABC transporter permease [Alphaproteobacteria bacterium]